MTFSRSDDSRCRRSPVVALALLLALIAPVGPAAADGHRADEHRGDGHRVTAQVSRTGADFWQWALTQPAATNPLVDTTGEFCAVGQRGHRWFLAGSLFTPEPVTRTCEIPRGTRLTFPVVNAFYGATPGDPAEQSTVEFARSQVAGIRDGATLLRVTVDGEVLRPSRITYLESRVFSVTLPEGNLFGLPEGTVVAPMVDAGYYVTLPPLRPGTHTVHIEGVVESTAPPGSFSVDVTYRLTVTTGRTGRHG